MNGEPAGKSGPGEATFIVMSGALFTMFWTAQAVSLFGDRLNNFSLIALVNRFSEDPSLQLSGIYAAMYLPVFILAPVAGVIVDRLSKRWVLAATDLVRGLLVLLIPVAFSATGSFIPVMAVVFLISTGNILFLPAKAGLLPEIVPPEKLVKVNSILWIAGIAGVIGGFLGGGVIFDYFSWEACFHLDGATYIFSALLLTVIALRLPHPGGRADGHGRPDTVSRKGFWHSAAEGLAEIRGNRSLIAPLSVQSLIFFGAGGFSVLAVVLVGEVSKEGSSMGLAVAGLSAGAGMAAGSFLAHRLGQKAGRLAEAVLFLLFAPAAAAVAFSPSLILTSIGMFIAGLAATPLFVISESQLQVRIPPGLRGRVFSLREIITRSLFLASSFLMSFLGRMAGKGVILLLLGLFLAIFGVIRVILSGSERADNNNF
jgi:DHA3 family macrolide efflux protein-like MFS transporter